MDRFFSKNGYDLIAQLIHSNLVTTLKEKILESTKQDCSYGIRDLHYKILEINKLAKYELISDSLKQYTIYSKFKLIKAIFFNKNQHHNWLVGWHQDKTIGVKKKYFFLILIIGQ